MHDLIHHLLNFWNSLIHKPLFGLLLTLVIFQISLRFYNICGRKAFVHPVAISVVIIAAFLKFSHISYREYVQANDLLYFLLGPTTVALAIPWWAPVNLDSWPPELPLAASTS